MNNSLVKHFFFSMFVAIATAWIPKNQLCTLLYLPVPLVWEAFEYIKSKTDYTDDQWKETRKDLIASYLGFAVGYGIGYLLRHNHSIPTYWSA